MAGFHVCGGADTGPVTTLNLPTTNSISHGLFGQKDCGTVGKLPEKGKTAALQMRMSFPGLSVSACVFCLPSHFILADYPQRLTLLVHTLCNWFSHFWKAAYVRTWCVQLVSTCPSVDVEKQWGSTSDLPLWDQNTVTHHSTSFLNTVGSTDQPNTVCHPKNFFFISTEAAGPLPQSPPCCTTTSHHEKRRRDKPNTGSREGIF